MNPAGGPRTHPGTKCHSVTIGVRHSDIIPALDLLTTRITPELELTLRTGGPIENARVDHYIVFLVVEGSSIVVGILFTYVQK